MQIIDSFGVDVEGNYIGTDAGGTDAIPNQRGVEISGNSSQNTVGAAVDGPSNVISGNAQVGVLLTAIGGECAGQTVFNNLIGVGADEETDLGQPVGIRLEGSDCNQIGLQDMSGNVIAFNGAGIEIVDSEMNFVAGNWIGTSPFDGPELDGNDDGIVISGTSEQNVIGGSENQRNVIANNDNGVVIESDQNEVQNNYIGTDWTGNTAAGNSTGVLLGVEASGNLIGGDGAGNVISGNSDSGVRILGSDNAVQSNRIGVGVNLSAVPNQIGVRLEAAAADNLIGGATEIFCEGSGCSGESNVIALNGGGFEGTVGGIVQTGTGTGNTYSRNRIYETDGFGENDALGIDLGPTGVTPNDLGDPDTGPNKLQNFPVIENVVPNDGSIDLSGELDTEQFSGTPGGDTYVIEFFISDTCDPSGNGEGQNFIGSILVVEDDVEGFGPEPWETTLGGTLEEGEVVTATATNPDGSTSEYSECASEGAAAAEATITLESDQASVIAGAQTVPTGGIDLADLKRGGGTTQPTPLDSIPLDSIPLDSVPLDSIPLDSIGFTADLLNQALGGVHLSDIPISTPPGGWPEKLAGTALANVPLNTITLADVYRLNEASGPGPDPIPLDSIPLDSIDLTGTPLDSIPLGAIAMGATPLDSIPLDSIGTNNATENAADWCAALNPPTGGGPDPVPGYSCPPIDPSTETLIGLSVRGVPLDSIPLDSIPLDSIPLDSIPLDSIPLDSIPLDSIPLDSIPLDSIPLDSIPLDSINFAVSPLDSIPLDSIGPGIIECSGGYCTAQRDLGDADADGRIIPGTTLFDLMGALQPGNGASVADLIYGLPTPPRLTLGDLFALVIGGGQGTYDWATLDLNAFPIALHSPDGGVITYHTTFEVTGGSANPTATIHAALPTGGRYKPGSSQLVEGETTVPIGEPQVGPTQLEWTRSIQRGVQYELTWQVHAPIQLGNYGISTNVIVPGMESAALSNAVDVDVVQTLEPNDTPGAGAILTDSTLYLGYVLPGDVDRHRVTIPTAFGSRVRITLSHIAKDTDLDLTVAGPPSPRLRNAPGNTIPLQNAQLPDSKVELDERTQALPPETLEDVPTAAITAGPNVIRATSDNRGSADEEVNLVSQGESGQYIVQVSDYEGDSPLPYMLEVEVEGPPNLGACAAPRSFPAEFAGQGVIGTMPTIPANVNTLILVNQQRLGRTYGNAAATNVMNSLNQLAGRADLGIVGAVIPVDSSLAIRNAYDAWDGNPCSPEAANNIVQQIGQLVDGIEPDNLQYKVIVGGDDQIPFGRVADETLLANEQDYTASLSGPNNQYKAAFGHGLLMTDDVYAEEAAPEFLGHELFVPDQAIGRLVETPNEITGMISAFLAPAVNGAIAPQRSLTTGYDFLTDGTTAVNAPFTTRFGAANARTLINETWPAKDANTSPTDDLEDALFPTSPTLPPQINAVNAHFDHTRLLPAAENAANRAANLYTSQDVLNRGANAVAQRILFSMGCHSGLATSDAVYGSTNPLSKDWAQTFLGGGAFAWIGNTGFGLGDTVDVAYTERLHALLSANLNGALTLGEALAQAKQQYLSSLGIVSGYDAKVLMQTTLYGLPMLDIGAGTAPATPPPAPLQTDAATGLQAASFNQTPTFTLVTRPDGKYYRAQSTQATNRRPIEPLVSFDVTQPGLIAHGVVITSLQSGADEVNFDAAFSRIVTDKAEDEPELVGEASHPAQIQSLSTFSHFASPATTRQNAVLIPGLYRSDGVSDPAGIGIHRLYNQIGGYVVYALPSETDFTPPELGALDSLDIGSGSVGFGVDVTDTDGLVKDVKVIYRDCAGIWRLSTLQNSGGTRWSGGGALASTCEQIDYYLQAVDDAGNVAVSSKKVQIEPLVLPAPTGDTDITITPSGTLHASGWYTSAVSVAITADPASTLEYSLSSLDDGALQNYTGPFSVGGTGLHFVEAFAEDGSTATAAFAIDRVDPTVQMTTPPAGAVYTLGQVVKANYTCADSGSGIASCNPAAGSPANGANLNTSSLGTKTVTVTATDMVGRTATLSLRTTSSCGASCSPALAPATATSTSSRRAGGTPVQLTTGNVDRRGA